MAQVEVVLDPDAEEEYAAALRWYAERREGLGDAFEREVDRCLRLIADAPNRWPRYAGRYRRFPVRRFPYSIIYVPEDDRVWVLAMAHRSRRPGYWRYRTAGE